MSQSTPIVVNTHFRLWITCEAENGVLAHKRKAEMTIQKNKIADFILLATYDMTRMARNIMKKLTFSSQCVQ